MNQWHPSPKKGLVLGANGRVGEGGGGGFITGWVGQPLQVWYVTVRVDFDTSISLLASAYTYNHLTSCQSAQRGLCSVEPCNKSLVLACPCLCSYSDSINSMAK